jgi:hypothetical protein
MTDRTLTPNDVALQLSRLARQLDELVGQIDAAERHAVTAREDFTLAYANAFLAAEGSIEARKHKATVATHVQRLAAEAGEQVVKGIRRQIDSVKLRVDVGRSLGAALRAELGAMGGQP